MKRRYLTFDDLYDFFVEQNKSFTFKSGEDGSIVVQVPIDNIRPFEDEYDPNFGLLKVHLKSCHLFRNRNGSSISEESMLQAAPSFYNRPILGYIHQLNDGSYDFGGHEITLDEDGNFVYVEVPVGVIPESCNPQLVYDEDMDKTYLEVDGYIYEDYSRAADILREKTESKVSIEICVDEMSYSASEKVLNIDKFHFLGVTILGKTDDEYERQIEEGMLGSKITIADFSKNNSLIEMLENMNSKIDALSNFTINKDHGKEETGVDNETKLEETTVVEQVEEPSEDPVVDDSVEIDDSVVEVGEDEDAQEDDEVLENESLDGVSFTVTSNRDGRAIVYEISHDDIRNALYNLIGQYEEMDNDWYFIESVYDDHFVMRSWGGQIYGQKYTVDGDDVALDGERYKLYQEYLTESEKAELDSMRANYSLIKEQLDKYVAAENKEKKEAIISDECYDCIRENTDFQDIQKDMDQFSVEDVQNKCDALLLSYHKSNKVFSAEPNYRRKVNVNAQKEESYSPYGDLFKDYKNK